MTSTSNRQAGTAESVGTAVRTVRVLAALADADGRIGVGALAERLELATSTVHRILQLLKQEGFVAEEDDTRQYHVGPEFYRVAARVVASLDVVELARPHVQDLADQFDESVLFALYHEESRSLSFAVRADGTKALQYRIDLNRPLSLVWGASGKAILAWLPELEILEILRQEKPSPATGEELPSRGELFAELERVRSTGYAVTGGEKLPEARGIAAPVFGPAGVVGCLCLTSPKDRTPNRSIPAIGVAVQAKAAALSRELGTRPRPE
ncbi:DNA-binding IclR family transcriptional regulator [Actinoalloteichus hoggarensis]|uniref:Glycerol operon regulatory protein n=1 Tax=Actinoalloteichus hoggarensis TaxID=1470176 RepID=A0A221W7Q5_9PSEU|nr:IclR family transcriptional regulator [Actinoalloteichus hoggarensis]ASO21691.1 Pectin degradation repressor protein KdgR [Actinoalloteichus hoggarensis]MBB5922286.1 DNA-binding IclR family transcriptional regulator [Actinoalloteichus hoggarensis]